MCEYQLKLIALGKLLAEKFPHANFRSGNVPGADTFFSQGVNEVDASRWQVVVPYTNRRKKENIVGLTISLDDIDLAKETSLKAHSKAHKGMAGLSDQYVAGERHRNARKVAYILRDTWKVIGCSGVPAVSVDIFYDDLANPMSGGTGHIMRISMAKDVLFVDHRVWMGWH